MSAKIVVVGDAAAVGTSAKLDVFHDCFQYDTTTVNTVRETQTWWSILERILSDWVDGGVEVRAVKMDHAADAAANRAAWLRREVLAGKPDYVLVAFGSEDALECVEPKAFEKALGAVVSAICATKATAVLVTPTPFSERMTADCDVEELRRRQERLSQMVDAVRVLAKEKSLPLIDLHGYFLGNRLAYDHLFNGWLPDAVAQTAMAPFFARHLLRIMGIKGFPAVTLCDYRKAYSDAGHPDTKHNGFTDMICFRGEFFLCFRNGQGHGDGKDFGSAVVLRSQDGINWVKDAVLQLKGADNRDPKFLDADGRLMVYTPCIFFGQTKSGETPIITYGFERLGPGKWGKPFECVPSFFWRPKKWRGEYVAAPYVWADKKGDVKLVSSPDGRHWREVSVISAYQSGDNETDLWTEGAQLMAFSRHDPPGQVDNAMRVAVFQESDNTWKSKSAGRIVHAPCVFEARGRLFVAGRTTAYPEQEFGTLGKEFSKVGRNEPDGDRAAAEKYHNGLRTGLFVMDGTRARQVMELLSAGDSSYCGAVQYGDEYLISDYSMHEYYRPVRDGQSWVTPSDIYVSRIRVDK